MDKTTWIWFLPDPKDDEIATRDEKIKAVEQCIIKKFPSCNRIEKIISYNRGYDSGLSAQTGLIVIIDRVDDVFSALYKDLGFIYGLAHVVYSDETFDPDNRWSKPINKIKIPPELNIKDYLPKVKGLKLESMRHDVELVSSRMLSLIRREGIADDSLFINELGIPLDMLNVYLDYLLSNGKIIQGSGYIHDAYKRVRVFALPGEKDYEKSSKRYEYVDF